MNEISDIHRALFRQVCATLFGACHVRYLSTSAVGHAYKVAL